MVTVTTKSGKTVELTRKGAEVLATIVGMDTGSFGVRAIGTDLQSHVAAVGGRVVTIQLDTVNFAAAKVLFDEAAEVQAAHNAGLDAYDAHHARVLRAMER